MKAVGKNVILRYRKADLDILKKQGLIFLVDSHKSAENVCSIAVIESTNHPDLKDGDEAIVSFRIGYDEDLHDRGNRNTNQYFIELCDNGDHIRWCDEYDVFGVVRKGNLIPKQEYLFCEVPPPVEEKVGSIFIPDSYRNQKTDNDPYRTKIKYIHPETSKETGMKEGDEIVCEKNSDIKKTIFDKEFLAVPLKKVMGKIN